MVHFWLRITTRRGRICLRLTQIRSVDRDMTSGSHRRSWLGDSLMPKCLVIRVILLCNHLNVAEEQVMWSKWLEGARGGEREPCRKVVASGGRVGASSTLGEKSKVTVEAVGCWTRYSTPLVVWTGCSISIDLNVSNVITAKPPTILIRVVSWSGHVI